MNETQHPFTPVGAHVPVAGGMATKGLAYADQIGAETVQVFTSNPRGWATKEGDPKQDERMRGTELPVFVHSPYLINLGTPNEETAEKSLHSLGHTMRRGAEIGAGGVVVHTGSAVSGGREAGLSRTRERLMPLLEELGDGVPPLLLEPMAGQGQVLCATVDDLVPYFEALDWHPNVGVCLDTAHLFAAGHDISTRAGMREALDRFGEVVGADRLYLIHANDSKAPCASNKDRHENIGKGHIGSEPFGELFTHPVTAGVPITLETPGPEGPHGEDVATLKSLRP